MQKTSPVQSQEAKKALDEWCRVEYTSRACASESWRSNFARVTGEKAMRYIHEIAKDGRHRLGSTKYNAKSPTKESPVQWGEWADYKEPAMKGQYLAVTDHYKGSVEFPDPALLYRVNADVWPLDQNSAD